MENEESDDEDVQTPTQEPRTLKRLKSSLEDSPPSSNQASANPFENPKGSKKPDLSISRIWTDNTGNFQTEAKYLGVKDGILHLHKSNGVKITVPAHKMSLADLELIDSYELSSNSLVELSRVQKKNLVNKPRTYPVMTRGWTDRSGEFKTDAAFLGTREGKAHLHKANGIKISVPLEKLSFDDLAYIRGRPNVNDLTD